ncbi:Gfo/Idh/MocA family oxidoreductase [Lysinibacter sp. HNR]|uniref:Gfo/Idh/MocA family protein n=1 Tax=Lysinibacter sp. HNR TaxID=3031408 RepID=UPI002434C620|nr:Gfo/Idh/MocA family oxidoreductase [Lysinibacter sp. HNR]WGD38087.1 Gfo/Idh/MocA family oxidoreductase [Lysinibacter sp. HNR]
MTANPRIALIGAGNMGRLHARVISQSNSAELTYIIDPRESVGHHVAESYNTTWLPELPGLKNIDAVVIAAATEAHYELAKQVLEQDTALLIEKPIADSLANTQEIITLADTRDLPLMCGLLERYNPAVMTAQALLHEPLHIVATRHSPYTPRIRTGVAWDLLVHDVDLSIQIMQDEPSLIDSRLGFYHPDSLQNAEDVAETLLGFEHGGLARISASRIGQKKTRELSIYEQERLIEVDLLRRGITVYRHVSGTDVDKGLGYRQQTIIEIPELVSSEEPLTAQFNQFLRVLNDSEEASRERKTLLPAHQVVEQVTRQRPNSTK